MSYEDPTRAYQDWLDNTDYRTLTPKKALSPASRRSSRGLKEIGMNYRQKLGYMALGAGILVLGIAIGQWTTPNIEAQNNSVFDEITCQSLKMLDKAGKVKVVLIGHEEGGSVAINDKVGKPAILLEPVLKSKG